MQALQFGGPCVHIQTDVNVICGNDFGLLSNRSASKILLKEIDRAPTTNGAEEAEVSLALFSFESGRKTRVCCNRQFAPRDEYVVNGMQGIRLMGVVLLGGAASGH